jgi:hypothetical protein
MAAPVLIQPIPPQIVNELASYGPFDLKKYIQSAEGSSATYFSAELHDGRALPTGMILTGDGIFTGIPAKNTEGNYKIIVTAENDSGTLKETLLFTIKPAFMDEKTDHLDKLKAQIWEALEHQLPIPETGLDALLSLPITKLDVYYLLERWSTLTIWDAFNLDPPSQKIPLTLKGASEHYHVYDRGSSLIMSPKDLFSHERTIQDGIQTAKAMAREVYQRGWTIEMAGLDKWTHATWIELQMLGDRHGKHLDILNYEPSTEELHAYSTQSQITPLNAPE